MTHSSVLRKLLMANGFKGAFEIFSSIGIHS